MATIHHISTQSSSDLSNRCLCEDSIRLAIASVTKDDGNATTAMHFKKGKSKAKSSKSANIAIISGIDTPNDCELLLVTLLKLPLKCFVKASIVYIKADGSEVVVVHDYYLRLYNDIYTTSCNNLIEISVTLRSNSHCVDTTGGMYQLRINRSNDSKDGVLQWIDSQPFYHYPYITTMVLSRCVDITTPASSSSRYLRPCDIQRELIGQTIDLHTAPTVLIKGIKYNATVTVTGQADNIGNGEMKAVPRGIIGKSTQVMIDCNDEKQELYRSIYRSFGMNYVPNTAQAVDDTISVIPQLYDDSVTSVIKSYIQAILTCVRGIKTTDNQGSIFSSVGSGRISTILLTSSKSSSLLGLLVPLINAYRMNFKVISMSHLMTAAHGSDRYDTMLVSLINSAIASRPCAIILDNLDLITPMMGKQQDDSTEVTSNIKSTIQRLLSSSATAAGAAGVLVIATTSNITYIDADIRKQFSEKLNIANPNAKQRRSIARYLGNFVDSRITTHPTAFHTCITDKNAALIEGIADSLIGCNYETFACSYIKQHMRTSASAAVMYDNRYILDESTLFSSVSGHKDIKTELTETIIWPRKYSNLFARFHILPESGVLLYGPPGTGKTLLPRSIAQQLNCTFLPMKLSDVVHGSIGDGEKSIVDIFQEAKNTAPSVVYIDEFQAIFVSRDSSSSSSSSSGGGGDGIGQSLSSTLASCFDDIAIWNGTVGTESLITVIASTNEPWSIDKGFLRPGRLERRIFVGPLDRDGRLELMTKLLCGVAAVDHAGAAASILWIDKVADRTDGYSGADINLLVYRAKLLCKDTAVTEDHFNHILLTMKPSISASALNEYMRWKCAN